MNTKPVALDQEFIDLVGKDVRGITTREQHAWLNSEEMMDRRHAALIAVKKDVESQLAHQRARWVKKRVELNQTGDDGTAWLEFCAHEQDWRVRAIKFLLSVDDHIAASKEIRRAKHQLTRGDAEEELARIKELIRRHRDEFNDDDGIADVDRELWAVLEA